LREFRNSKGLTIEAFWKPIGVTKSGGSRYETCERKLPDPVAKMLYTAYGYMPGMTSAQDVKRVHVSSEEAELISYLRENPDVLNMVNRLKNSKAEA
jgi:hypothetical protein